MSGFKVINAGVLTQVQDCGRFGYSHIGISNSGVSDEYAYNVSNYLLNNKQGTNTLEISFSNVELEALANTTISITGADLSLYINSTYCKPWQTYSIIKGDKLKFRKKVSGQKAYLSVKGGFQLKKELNSYSTTIKEEFGTLLTTGMILPYSSYTDTSVNRLKEKYIPSYSDELTLRVILGYQFKHFSQTMLDTFFDSTFIVSNEANRMGIKLYGEKIVADIDGIISEGIALGSIQIPNDGKPIILLKERQTIGGYPKIGSVISIDCFKLAQAPINTEIRFKCIELKKAQEKMRRFKNLF